MKNKIPLTWMSTVLLTVGVALSAKLVLPSLPGGWAATYLYQPFVWILLWVWIRFLPRYNGLSKRRLRSFLIKFALGLAAFQVYLMVIAGFLDKFGKNPHSITLSGILVNIFYVAAGLLGTESSRAWLINSRLRRPSTFLPVMIAIIYTLIVLPYNQFPGANLESLTKFAGSNLFPLFMENLVTSFLAMWGGIRPALAYRSILSAFTWFCPVVPDLNWAMRALTGTVVPVIGLAILQEYCFSQQADVRYRRTTGSNTLNYLITSIMAVIVIWFSLGVFPVRPLVIYSGSMRPAIEVGDITILAKRNTSLLRKGDLISYKVKDRSVPTVHRIVAVGHEEGKEIFITKGDANNQNDLPVPAENVTGKVILVVPKLGWASIAVRKLFI